MPTTPFTYPNPQPTAGVLTFDGAINQTITADVYTKQRWADAWTLNNKLECTDLNWTAAPTIPTASLRYRYGRVLERGATEPITRARLANPNGYYVKIVVHCTDGDRVWHGFVDDVADAPFGIIPRIVVPPEPDEPYTVYEASGVQTLSCLGMMAAMDRAPLWRTYFQCTTTFSVSGSDTYRMSYAAPIFNVAPRGKKAKVDKFGNEQLPETRPASTVAVPNFTTTAPVGANARNAYLFCFPGLYGVSPTVTLSRWKLNDVLQHLVCFCAPRSDDFAKSNEWLPFWIFDPSTLAAPLSEPVPDWVEPLLDCEGLTLKGALDRLLALEKGLGYHVWVDETSTPHRVYIEPFTTLQTDGTITLDAVRTLEANNRQLKIVQAADAATQITLQQNAATNYTKIQVMGAPEIAVCTLPHTVLVNGWSTTLQTAYDAEISGLNTNILRELYQARDIRERAVYRPIGRNFVAGNTFNWKCSITPQNIFSKKTVTASTEQYLPYGMRLRFLDDLPLKQSVDYSLADQAAIKDAHKAARAKYRAAEAYAKTFASDGTLTGKRICWTTKAIRDIVYDLYDPSYFLRVTELENEIAVGIAVDVVNGYQGALAAGGGTIAPHVPRLDPTQLEYTLAIASDYDIEFSASITAPGSLDAQKVKRIEFGDRFQYIRIAKDTIVGVNNSTDAYKRVQEDLVIRDDQLKMKEIAFLLQQYYTQSRNILRLSTRRPTAKIWPGQLITKTDEGTELETIIGAVVSEVSISMPIGANGSYSPPTMNVVTNRGELDPLAFLPALE